MEEGRLVQGVSFSFRSRGWPCTCAPITWGSDGTRMHWGKTTSWWRECDALGNVLLGNPGSGHSFERQFDTCHLPKHRCRPGTPLQNTKAMVFPDGSGLFQQDNAPCRTAHIVREWFEEHDEMFTVLLWPPNFPDINLIEHLWDLLDRQVRSTAAPPRNFQDLKELLLMFDARYRRTPSGVLSSPCLSRSALFWRHTEDQHHIRQVVIMFRLISVYVPACTVVAKNIDTLTLFSNNAPFLPC